MRKIVSTLLALCMLLSLAACQNNPDKQVSETLDPTENQIVADNTGIQNDDPDAIKPLTLEKALHSYYEWADDYDQALVRSEHSCVTLGQEDAALYPDMAEVLNQIATMQENAMLDEFDNFVAFAKDELNENRSGFETYVSTLDVQVRRADSLVISLLSDSYSDYGQIQNCRVLHGTNYDTQTGRELALNEVVNVNNDLALAVQKELTSHLWTGEFYYEYVVEDYFANTPYDGFSWTLDYTGVTFYFAPGELCDEGAMTASVSFAEYPELFVEKYMAVPASYTVELPLDISFFTDLNADGQLDQMSISGWYDEERNHYMDFGVYTEIDAQYYYEECFVSDFHPYYVKAAGRHYLYLFCEYFEEGMRQMELIVLSLNQDGSITKSGKMNVSPSMLSDNRFIVPTNPDCFVMDNPEDGVERVKFTVGDNGMPSR